eukprot:CAMPEP_0197563114 /NCGR_PEP_ID=MMETSP1320-20131121/28157_1 /TAXON_ID=91990 /ORGANISM="Bolidomonas sp., Strain RCC2347" /LENGTH=41 /DNA_ID= /DNA_START= /DNA_END= /DNA_ORIENTATION=
MDEGCGVAWIKTQEEGYERVQGGAVVKRDDWRVASVQVDTG